MVNGLVPQIGGDPKRLTYDQIKEWNKYMDSKPQGTGLQDLYATYLKSNPKTTIDYPSLENEMNIITANSKRLAAEKHTVVAENTSTGNRFPQMEYNGQNLGPVNGDLKTQTDPSMQASIKGIRLVTNIPSYVKELRWDPVHNLPFYIDEQTGDTQYTEPKNFYNPRFKKIGLQNSLTP